MTSRSDTPSERLHDRLLEACQTVGGLPETAAWYSTRVAAAVERQGRDPWTLTLAEVRDLMIEAMPQEPRT